MNTLSWMIYLAGVTEGIGFMVGAFLLFLAAAIVIAGIMVAADPGEHGHMKGRIKTGAMVWLAAGVAASFVPSKETVYAIAASEMGGTALKSETGGKAVKALNAWLDRQIADEGEAE